MNVMPPNAGSPPSRIGWHHRARLGAFYVPRLEEETASSPSHVPARPGVPAFVATAESIWIVAVALAIGTAPGLITARGVVARGRDLSLIRHLVLTVLGGHSRSFLLHCATNETTGHQWSRKKTRKCSCRSYRCQNTKTDHVKWCRRHVGMYELVFIIVLVYTGSILSVKFTVIYFFIEYFLRTTKK